jgi:hypothetical protein
MEVDLWNNKNLLPVEDATWTTFRINSIHVRLCPICHDWVPLTPQSQIIVVKIKDDDELK